MGCLQVHLRVSEDIDLRNWVKPRSRNVQVCLRSEPLDVKRSNCVVASSLPYIRIALILIGHRKFQLICLESNSPESLRVA